MRAATVLVALVSLQATPSLETALSRVHDYVVAYEARLSQFVADEAMKQTHVRAALTLLPGESTWRELRSEVAFLRLPGDGPWLGYRNVIAVDGKPVTERPERLLTLLARGPDEAQRAIDMALASARFNLGLPRTTNVPTLPLEFVHPRHRDRLAYKLHGTERVSGRRLRRVSFVEVVRPTLIRSPAGGNILSQGSVWIEEPTGRVFEAEVRSIDGDKPGTSQESVLRVSFAAQPDLDMLVPVRMRETFPVRGGAGSGDARYTNFRRFETSARIVPQP